MRYLLLTWAVTVLSIPMSANAQGCQRTSPDAAEDIEEIAATFYDPESGDVRGTAIQLLTSADTAYVVRHDATCQAVLEEALPYLRQHHPLWVAGQEGNYQATVYRFGPYYAVELVPEDRSPPPTPGTLEMVRHDHRATLMVYRASDLTLLKLLA